MAFKRLSPSLWAFIAGMLAFVALYPEFFFRTKESFAIVTFDTATLREQLTVELETADPMVPVPKLKIPDFYEVHMRTLCRGDWMNSTSGGYKVKDPLSISCEFPGAISSWIFRFGWVLLSGTWEYKNPQNRGVPMWERRPQTDLFPYNDYCTHQMSVSASLLLTAGIMALVNCLVFLDMGMHRPRCRRFFHYQAVFFQFVAASCTTIAVANIASFARKATAYKKSPEKGLVFDLDVYSGAYYQKLITLAAFVLWISAVVALRYLLWNRSEGKLALPISDGSESPLLGSRDKAKPAIQ